MPDTTTTVQIDNEIIELTGQALDDFKAQRKLDEAEAKAIQAEADAKLASRQSALAKLAAIGLTPEEIEAL